MEIKASVLKPKSKYQVITRRGKQFLLVRLNADPNDQDLEGSIVDQEQHKAFASMKVQSIMARG